MSEFRLSLMKRFLFMAMLGLSSCTSIAVFPSCPSELQVGETGNVSANAQQPGAVPTYSWEVIPAGAGTFGDPTAADTTFVPSQNGTVLVRITASDGLFLSIAQCPIVIRGSGTLAVALAVSPLPTSVAALSTLTCSGVGQSPATSFSIEQTGGATVTLFDAGLGTVTFTPDAEGQLSFQCIGQSSDGRQSPPTTLNVDVQAEDDGRPPGRDPRR